MAWIRNKNGQQLCEVKKLSYNGVFMDVASITVTVESAAPIDFSIGDYIEWDYDGIRYTLDTAAGVEKVARRNTIGNAFVYENLVFLSPLKAADNVDFLDVILGNTVDFLTNTEFSFYGTAWDYAKRLEANLCRVYGSGSWKVRIWTNGVCYDTTPATLDTGSWESKLVDVSKIKCLAGFQQIYDLWGCAYVFSVINGVNYVDFYDDFEQYAKAWKSGGVDKIFAYGKGNGLYKIRHTSDADHVLVTRLRAYGSSENLPANYYLNSPDYHVDGNESSELAIANLMLPASEWTKDGVKRPANAYLEQNTDLYGVREGTVAWDGSDEELGEIKATIYGLTIQDLLDLMSPGDSYRPIVAKWPDTSQRIDKIITGAAPADNGAVAESGYDFTVVEAQGAFSANELSAARVYNIVDFGDLTMATIPSVGHLADYRVVPTSENVKVASFDVPASVIGLITDVNAYITPYVNGVKVDDATIPCMVSSEVISREVGGVEYTKRYYIHLLDANSAAVVFSTMRTGAVTFKIQANITYSGQANQVTVLRNEYAVNFNLLRGNKAIDKFFSVIIPQIGFDLSAAMTGSAKLCMRSGYNQPREFPIVASSVRYDSATDTWYLRCKRVVDQSTKTYFPNSDAIIATGDEYYFSGIAMPALYVEIAARKLLAAARAWLELHSKPRMLSSVDVDNKIMAVEGIVLREGMSLPIDDDDLSISPETQESRIIDNIRIEEGDNSIRTFSVTLRDKKERSSIDSAIRGATSGLATSASVSEAVSAAESRDHGALTGRDMPNQHPISAITGLEDALAARAFFEEDGEGGVRLKAEYSWLAVGEARMSWEDEDEYFHVNQAVVTEGDQIVIDGEPGGGGGGGGSQYLHELLDVTITNPADGQALVYRSGVWVNENISIDLSNYYTKPQVDALIGAIRQFHYEIYPSTSAVTNPQSNVLYLIGPTGTGSDKYEEYVYANGAWTKIGDTSIDLSGYAQITRLDADEAIISEAIQSLQSQIDAVSARNNYDELTATSFYADIMAATYAYAERYYLTDDVYFSIEKVNGTACVRLNAPFITDGDQIIISGTPGSGGGGSGVTLYDYTQVKAMTADVALTAPSAWAMHQMWAEIFGGASSVLTSGNYTNYVNTTNFPGLDKLGTVTSVATGTGLTGGPITSAGVISIDPTYLGYISHGETAYGWGDILTQAIQSFQSQIDSVSARDAFDELTAMALYADTGAISALYAGSIELGGEDLATAVSGIRGRLASVENKFDADGSALSAVRLKTARTLWGQNFDGTANVVGNMTSVGSIDASGLIKTTNYAQAQRFYLTDSIYFYTETIDGVACVMLNAPFVTSGDQIIISGTPGGGGQGVGYLYELEDVSDALASPTSGMVLFYNGTEWVGVAASSIGGVTSVVGQTGAVTTEQVANALTAAGYKLTDTITTSLAWSAITNTPTTLAGYGITDAASVSAISALTIRVGTLESDEAVVSAAIQSLQSQIDSVSARDQYDELTATVLFADTLSASSAYIESITGSLSGNAATASRLVGASYNIGNVYKPVYFSGGLPVACTYSINAATMSGTAGRLAYYAGANAISDFYNTIGGAYQPMYLNAGVPTACTYTLNAALLASSTAGRLAYYSGTNAVSEYYGNIGSGIIPMYLNAGVPTASTSTVGSASLPVYLNAGTITACTPSSLFSALGSNTVNNLEVTIAGSLRTITNLYATYDRAGENISDKFTIVSSAIQSLQSQIDSVVTRFGTDECIATTAYFDMLSVGAYIYAGALVTTGDQAVASDATLKKHWRGLNYGIEDIARATAGVFDWKDGHGTSAGTIAQEWKALIPELVHGEEGGMSLAYGQAAMLNTILLARHETEQDREIRELKEKVARLENKVERLRN